MELKDNFRHTVQSARNECGMSIEYILPWKVGVRNASRYNQSRVAETGWGVQYKLNKRFTFTSEKSEARFTLNFNEVPT